ncbi:MAG: hypothetical protein MUF05_05550 [Candidatus Omnitrophica bacterium]|jgi:DNA polymerase III delta subunit|nr:hypothetical protein [Candidatus Omnitrophota bacterium]
MVSNAASIYLFLGESSQEKDASIDQIKEKTIPKNAAQFNLELCYARDLNLSQLQEKFLQLPFGSGKRLIIIKGIDAFKPKLKDFLLDYAKKPAGYLVLILESSYQDKRDEFINKLKSYSKVVNFSVVYPKTAFDLARQIETGRKKEALAILKSLLQEGEKPERIMGGLRHAWEADKHRIKLLLECDIEIKTGKLKPHFALEKMLAKLA